MSEEPQFFRNVFQADVAFLEKMIEWIRKVTHDCAFSVTERRKIEFALEEAFVNIVNHAYRCDKTSKTIELICCKHPSKQVIFKIMDKGMPFNPLLQPKHSNPSHCLEEQEEGGLGIFFMTHLMDDVHYERHHPFNVLTLVKNECQ